MRSIIVYYSLEGNTRYIAQQLQKAMGADVLCLEPVKPYPTGKFSKFWVGGRSVIFGQKPELKPYKFDETAYDTVILVTPVWADCYAPPIKTFLAEHDLNNKRIGLAASSGSGNAEKCFSKFIRDLKDCQIIASLSLASPKDRKKEEDIKKIQAFAKTMTAGK